MAVTEEEIKVRAVSASSLNDLLVCERRWAYSHEIDPEVRKGPPNKYLVLGQAFHAGIRAHYDEADPQKAMADAIAEQVANEGDPSLALEHSSGLFKAFKEWAAVVPFKPTHQEQPVEFECEGIKVVGFIDANTDDLIVDWKSAALPWDKSKVIDAWLQGTAYSIPTGIRKVRFVVGSYQEKQGRYDRVTKYQIGVHELNITDADIERFKALCKVYGPRIQSLNIDDYAISGAISKNFLCANKWCDYFSICPGGGKRGGVER